MAALAEHLGNQGCFLPNHLSQFLESLKVEHLSELERTVLVESMTHIDLSPPFDHCPDVDS